MTAIKDHAARVVVRSMRRQDLDQVCAIERESYPTPWSQAMVQSELNRPNGICLVAQHADRIVGYTLVSRQADVWHIMNVTVHPLHRGMGIGEALLRALFARADRGPHLGYTLEVRVSNERAIRLYRRLGFEDHGTRRRYYSDNGEDALIMWLLDGEPDAA